MKLIFGILFFTFSFVNGQNIESLCSDKEKKFINQYKNYTERDSLVLYKDSTFRREKKYWGFDEIDKKVFLGKWNLKDKTLYLLVQKKR